MATGEHQDDAMAAAGRRRCPRHGEVCRQRPFESLRVAPSKVEGRDDGRDVATSGETSSVACDEEDKDNQGGSVECQGEIREGEDGHAAQIEENDRCCRDREGNEASDHETLKELSTPVVNVP